VSCAAPSKHAIVYPSGRLNWRALCRCGTSKNTLVPGWHRRACWRQS
jgi:hypothetical protein